eukprot:scaffold52186_cov29-Tisochrysis_lutea.AAC.5
MLPAPFTDEQPAARTIVRSIDWIEPLICWCARGGCGDGGDVFGVEEEESGGEDTLAVKSFPPCTDASRERARRAASTADKHVGAVAGGSPTYECANGVAEVVEGPSASSPAKATPEREMCAIQRTSAPLLAGGRKQA